MEKIETQEAEQIPVDEYIRLDDLGLDINRLLSLFERRLVQSSASRLSEYVTGFSLEDWREINERTFLDHDIIRDKYGLPHEEAIFDDPAWYEDYLRTVAAREGIEITNKSDCGNFFTKYPGAAAVYFEDRKRAGVTIDKSEDGLYSQSLIYLEHEVIHGLQSIRTPSMPVEVMEYEAYLAASDFMYLESTFMRMSGSVAHWYRELSEIAGEEVLPVWDNAEYFIENVDGISKDMFSEDIRSIYEGLKQIVKAIDEKSSPDGSVREIDLGTMDFLSDTEKPFGVRDVTERFAP